MHDPCMEELTEENLIEMERRAAEASPGPWESSVEGRDHVSGDSFIRIVGGPDMYVSRDAVPASAADLDFIAAARQDVPQLIAEVRRLRRHS